MNARWALELCWASKFCVHCILNEKEGHHTPMIGASLFTRSSFPFLEGALINRDFVIAPCQKFIELSSFRQTGLTFNHLILTFF